MPRSCLARRRRATLLATRRLQELASSPTLIGTGGAYSDRCARRHPPPQGRIYVAEGDDLRLAIAHDDLVGDTVVLPPDARIDVSAVANAIARWIDGARDAAIVVGQHPDGPALLAELRERGIGGAR